jgi:general secretion pathway protein E
VLETTLNSRFLQKVQVIPLEEGADSLAVAMVDPLDNYAADAVRFAVGKQIVRFVAYPADFEAAFDRLYGEGKSVLHQIAEEAGGRQSDGVSDDIEKLQDIASEAPVVRLVNLLVTRAVEARASDIHIEPMPGQLRVRYRIDGVLHAAESPPERLGAAVISRIKIMAKLNIAERRLPQDGRISLAVRGRDIDMRVATTPTINGESVVLRILDRNHLALDFASLGFDDHITNAFQRTLNHPYGILLVTGPTGSGKTTTLYAALLGLNTLDRKILTIEDPVEYHLPGINQTQVKPQIGLTFAGALRAFLRHDPDVMMIGEIRDTETAQIAVQSALTGHLILSTLHTNDAASAIMRFLDMGVEDYLLTSTLNGVAAQRLVRTLCPHCREPYEPLPEFVAASGLRNIAPDGVLTLHRARGCSLCAQTGYRGRSAIVEVLPVTDAIRQAVLKSADSGAIKRIATAEGMQSMRTQGLKKALAGITTVEEVLRVTREV